MIPEGRWSPNAPQYQDPLCQKFGVTCRITVPRDGQQLHFKVWELESHRASPTCHGHRRPQRSQGAEKLSSGVSSSTEDSLPVRKKQNEVEM